MNDFYKIANEIAKIPDEEIKELSCEDRLKELIKFRGYFKEYYNSYNDNYIYFLEKIEKEKDLEERYILEYDFKKEVLSKDYNLDGLNYLLANILFKYGLAIEDYNEHVNLLKEKYDLELKSNWEKILSKKNLDLVEALSLLSFIQRSDYWDYEHMPLPFAIFDGTVDDILESIENNVDNENVELLEIFIK
ncbi:hypothetical protein [Methanobrevibacter olleyae]|uniref:Uncharacterized protein n=1 Tax=Methanobrevibacter olleyae TaxID=294671 RepID=A0A126QYQ7_METOL|nr:hypothetical protein [Methanobrevibacter olleyae]AMK14958.1 hypothetical protein YLM1_0398 [Methanobrevibacter olleyae]SFL65695.1 hypothetical protein SAMN02910297_01440 [Methanobrevibacter olleyae]